MPKVQNAMWRGPQEARTINDFGLALDQRVDKRAIISGVIFQVRILDDHKVTASLLNSAPKRSSLAEISALQEDLHLRMFFLQCRKNFRGTITRAIVHAKQLNVERN